jgi:hypothetical protein|tara:strand:- start:527 stop:1060 length:534 start_codon:yes stop_codon:yes gene_type:complete
MKIDEKIIFPTKIKKFYFNTNEISPLLSEISKLKNKIKETSYFYNKNNNDYGNGYYTDYENPAKIYEYEKLTMLINSFFQDKNVQVLNYWTAIYYQNSWHDTHNHKTHDCNFSSILYLTNNSGGTKFFSPNSTSEMQYHFESSEIGKFIIFPSELFHNVHHNDNSERIIISSNLFIS